MSAATPTFSQIKAQVAAIRRKAPDARPIGIRAPGRWTGDKTKRDGDQTYLVFQCDSPLAMRLALREEADAGAAKVLVTSLEEREISQDILVRLAKRRLFAIDSWQIVRSLFQAHSIDPRLIKHGWVADALLELSATRDCPPARGGFLDAEVVWPLLLDHIIGLTTDSPDLTAILRWSIDASAAARFRGAPEAFRVAAADWLAQRAGGAARTILQCVERSERPDALPLGLAASVIYHRDAANQLQKAAGKLEERYLGGRSPEAAIVERWSAAAGDVVRLQLADRRVQREQLLRADEILTEVQAEAFAHLSSVSPLGFDQRLERLGSRLVDAIDRQAFDEIEALQAVRQAVREHELASHESRRLERIDMALRLIRWLSRRGTEADKRPASLAEAAADHLSEGGFVDWARLALRTGDPVTQLSRAYARLFDETTRTREEQAKLFATLLRDWTAAGSTGDEVLPVERIMTEVVAPLAAQKPVLVLVIDGMSVAVCRELLADVARHDWIALCEPGRRSIRPGIATIPSVTEYSRTSLLCGKLRQGTALDERAGFAEHPALVAHCKAGYPPILFHKASLQESQDTVLAGEVRDAITSPQRRVVGVVINAVDDHLLKGEQIDTRWTRDEIKVLPALLHEAATAKRLVVIVSDHGHVLDCQMEAQQHDGGERWRPAEGQPTPQELRVEGPRVAVEGSRMIGPWTEKLRYGIKKNGYHGGLNPQEMVAPIAVLTSSSDYPDGWSEAPIETPVWWDEPGGVPAAPQQPAPKLKPTKRSPQETLFPLDHEEPEKPAAPETPVEEVAPQWVSRLLSSEVFEEQRRLGGRAIPDNEVFGRFLAVLDGRGGKMTSLALSRALDCPPLRLRGLLAIVQRVLNVDGYAVISRDETSDTIELNRDLLLRQFDMV